MYELIEKFNQARSEMEDVQEQLEELKSIKLGYEDKSKLIDAIHTVSDLNLRAASTLNILVLVKSSIRDYDPQLVRKDTKNFSLEISDYLGAYQSLSYNISDILRTLRWRYEVLYGRQERD